MAWQNFFDVYPDASVGVTKNGQFINPLQYASEGITVSITGGRVTLSFPPPDLGGDGAAIFSAIALVPNGNLIYLPTRLVNIDADPWPLTGSSEEVAVLSTFSSDGGVFDVVNLAGDLQNQTVLVTGPTQLNGAAGGIGLSVGRETLGD